MSMFDSYDNLDPNYVPDNLPKPRYKDQYILVTGETCTFSMNLDVTRNNLKDLIGGIEPNDKSIFFIFKNGIDVIYTKVATIIPVDEDDYNDCPIIITCELSAEETSTVKDLLQMQCQIKMILADDSINYTIKKPITIVNSIDNVQ